MWRTAARWSAHWWCLWRDWRLCRPSWRTRTTNRRPASSCFHQHEAAPTLTPSSPHNTQRVNNTCETVCVCVRHTCRVDSVNQVLTLLTLVLSNIICLYCEVAHANMWCHCPSTRELCVCVCLFWMIFKYRFDYLLIRVQVNNVCTCVDVNGVKNWKVFSQAVNLWMETSPPLWSRLKHLNNCWMGCHEVGDSKY